MKSKDKEQNQSYLDKKERLEEWRKGRLWYLKNFQSRYFRRLQSNKILQAHLMVVAEQAEELYQKKLSKTASDDFFAPLQDDTDLLCAVCMAYNEVLAVVMREVLFARPPEMGGCRR